MAGRCARFKFSREISPKKACQSRAKRVQDFPTWAEVAQLVEQGTENPRVGSSILSLGTTNLAEKVYRRPEILNKISISGLSLVRDRTGRCVDILWRYF